MTSLTCHRIASALTSLSEAFGSRHPVYRLQGAEQQRARARDANTRPTTELEDKGHEGLGAACAKRRQESPPGGERRSAKTSHSLGVDAKRLRRLDPSPSFDRRISRSTWCDLVGGGSPVTSRDCDRWPQDARERWAVRIGTISHLRELRGSDTIVPICTRGSSEFAHGP